MRDVTGAMPLGLRIRLSAMMFLQFMMFPVWFTTAVPYVRTLPGGEKWVMGFGMLMGVGTLASPVTGMFADRFLNAEKVMALSSSATAGLRRSRSRSCCRCCRSSGTWATTRCTWTRAASST